MKENSKKENNKVMEDGEIIDLYWTRNEDAIVETDKKYGKYLYAIA